MTEKEGKTLVKITNTHTHTEREREREREKKATQQSILIRGVSDASGETFRFGGRGLRGATACPRKRI